VSATRAHELRRAFDASFARAHEDDRAPTADVLAIVVGGEPRALALAPIASLHAQVAVIAIPSPAAELRGLGGVRNALLPVWDLAALLGLPRARDPRRVAIARGAAPIGLAFDEVLAHERIAAAELAAGAIAIAGARCALIDVARVIETIEARVRAHAGGS
jgi:purine-binding chemotaxis protein CheW